MEKEKHSLFSKIIVYIIVVILIVTPLSELIPGLEYVGYTETQFYMSCFGTY